VGPKHASWALALLLGIIACGDDADLADAGTSTTRPSYCDERVGGMELWSLRAVTSTADLVTAVAADDDGARHLIGSIGSAASNDECAASVVSYNVRGEAMWTRSFAGPDGLGFPVAFADGSDSELTSVDESGFEHFGGDLFVVTYASDGALRWMLREGDAFRDIGFATAFEPGGDLVVLGNYGLAVPFPASATEPLLAKYGPQGGSEWFRRLPGADSSGAQLSAMAADDSIALTGGFEGTVDVGGGPLTAVGSDDVLVASFDPDGSHRWSERFGGVDSDGGASIVVDAAGGVVVAGWFEDAIDFGGTPLASAGGQDLFVAQFTDQGMPVWSERFGGLGPDLVTGMALANDGTIVVVGTFTDLVDFGGGPLVSAGGRDLFVLQVASDGSHLYSRRFGSAADESVVGVALTPSGTIVVGGLFQDVIDFGYGELESTGGSDAFLAILPWEPLIEP